MDGNLSTYATIRFDPSDNPEGVIEVKLAGLMNVTIKEINHNHRSFLDFRVYVESTYCGTCGMSYECNIYCIHPVRGNKIFLKKYLQFNDLYSLLKIFEVRVYGQELEEGAGLSAEAIVGIVAGVFCLNLTLIYFVRHRKRRKARKIFYSELIAGYRAGREGRDLDGLRFNIDTLII